MGSYGGLTSIESLAILNCVFAQNTVQDLFLLVIDPKFLLKNVKNCTLISYFAQLLGKLVRQYPYRRFSHGPHLETSVPRPLGSAPTL